jgi:hypothetical protein
MGGTESLNLFDIQTKRIQRTQRAVNGGYSVKTDFSTTREDEKYKNKRSKGQMRDT